MNMHNFFAKLNKSLFRSKHEFENRLKYSEDLNKEIFKGKSNQKVVCVVFSKDRAMQLDAFLSSYFNKSKHFGDLIVLYTASTKEHLDSYTTLERNYKSKPIQFIKETNFRDQIIRILEVGNYDNVGLFVDDMIFTREFDWRDILKYNLYENVFVLTRGRDLGVSQVLQKKNVLPNFEAIDNHILSFRWNEFRDINDWSYPLGLSGYVYVTEELRVMIRALSFRAPNSLEASLQQYRKIFQRKGGLCYGKTVSVCVHANIVQNEWSNPTIEKGYSADSLLEYWNAGLCIDVSKFDDVDADIAQFMEYQFVKRKESIN